jgi:hypothetical protein
VLSYPPEFKEKFVAFIDIIGFRRLVEDAETGKGLSLTRLTNLLESFGSAEERDNYEKYGPSCCPQSSFLERNIDFRLTQVSDCAIVSAEVSPAGAINLISHCWGVVIAFLQHGMMCRGHITRGRIYHTATQFIGTGYQNAYDAERQVSLFKRAADERGTPFVEVDRAVCDYINGCEDACVKEMFAQMTKSDGDGIALFPFKRLSHSIIISGFGPRFDPDKEKRSNQNLRQELLTFRDRVMSYVDCSNPDALRKAEHYVSALNAQLEMCDRTDATIDKLCTPVSSRR